MFGTILTLTGTVGKAGSGLHVIINLSYNSIFRCTPIRIDGVVILYVIKLDETDEHTFCFTVNF